MKRTIRPLICAILYFGSDSILAAATDENKIATTPENAVQVAPNTVSKEELEDLLERARQAMAQQQYVQAILIYTKILEAPDIGFHQDALEFLGVARERRGQFAHAKVIYEKYVHLYPDTDGSKRVKQRLAALITAELAPKSKLRAAKQDKDRSAWQTFGSFSQIYRRDVSRRHSLSDVLNQSSLNTTLNVNSRRRTDKSEMRARFTGNYDYDFLNRSTQDRRLNVSSMFFDAAANEWGLSARVGRQTSNTGGVLGRFDGFKLSYQPTALAKINVVAGYPVNYSSMDRIVTDANFEGVSLDIGTFAGAWDVSTYYIQQTRFSILDRQAVGSEVRYFKSNHSVLGLLDYDIHFQDLNTFLILSSWEFANKITVNGSIDLRNSPIMTTNNALIGQGIASLKELRDLYSEEELKQLAKDRTPQSRTYTLGLTRPLGDHYQASGDMTITKLGATPASGGVDAVPSTGNDYFYSVQMTGTDLWMQGDFAIADLRYANTSGSNTVTLSLNTRHPLTPNLRVSPRFRLDLRSYKNDNSKQQEIKPSIRINYRWHKRYHFEGELGGDWRNRDLKPKNDQTTGYYLNLSYRIDL